ncbi:MAG: hypothetical protein IPJ03_11265 [Ignavibacteriales bacterium]|nr:hypothetical protein [Ignavibacteriales bacterium]
MSVFSFRNNITEKKIFIFLILAAILTEVFYLILAFNSEGKEGIPLYMFVYFEEFLIFFFSWLIIKRVSFNEKTDSEILKLFSKIISINSDEQFKLKLPLFIIVTGLLFRLTLFPSTPSTSDDVYRYVWEGKVVVNGFNPFTTPPNSNVLSSLQDSNYTKVTYKNIPAIYPPFSQLVFATAYILTEDNLLGLKLIYFICEFFTLIFLLKLLHLKKINLNRIILYAWLPLPIMEYFVNVHLDPVGIMFLIIAVYFIEREKFAGASVFLALSFLSKLIGIFLLPLIFRKAGINKSVLFIFIFSFVSIIFYLPFADGSFSAFTAFSNYLSNWEFNGSIYNSFKALFSNSETARMICGIIFISLVVYISSTYKDFSKAGFYIFLCWAILSTTLFSWYLGWLAVLNPFVNFFSVMSLLFTINLTNFSPLGNEWREYGFVLAIEYVPFFLLLVYDFLFEARKIKD